VQRLLFQILSKIVPPRQTDVCIEGKARDKSHENYREFITKEKLIHAVTTKSAVSQSKKAPSPPPQTTASD